MAGPGDRLQAEHQGDERSRNRALHVEELSERPADSVQGLRVVDLEYAPCRWRTPPSSRVVATRSSIGGPCAGGGPALGAGVGWHSCPTDCLESRLVPALEAGRRKGTHPEETS